MTGKQTIWYKKITAVFLLLVLLAITVIQVSHCHSPVQGLKQRDNSLLKRSILPEYKKAGLENKCFICEYQVTRDADASYFISPISAKVQYHLTTETIYSFVSQRINSFVETRGPPATA